MPTEENNLSTFIKPIFNVKSAVIVVNLEQAEKLEDKTVDNLYLLFCKYLKLFKTSTIVNCKNGKPFMS